MRRDLRRLVPADRTGALAQLGLTLAQVLDGSLHSGEVVMSPRDFASISAEFHRVLGSIAKLQAPPAVADPIDEVARRRELRRGAAG